MEIDPNRLIAANDNELQLELGLDLPPVARPPTKTIRKAAPKPDAPNTTQPPRQDRPETGAVAEVLNIKSERIARNPRMRELDEIMDEGVALMRERRKLVGEAWSDPQQEDAYIRQWTQTGSLYCKALTTLHKHHDFLSRDE